MLFIVRAALIAATAAFVIIGTLKSMAAEQGADLAAELPRIPPTSPADAMKTFQLKPGFRIEQVAAEPMVNSPVAMAFDEDGRLFVCEMRGYPLNAADQASSIRLLVDEDGDGRFDQSTVYVDKMRWPSAVACWDGGIFVADAPEVWYFKDMDGDGRADGEGDVRRKIFIGFGDDNCDGLLNSFTWSLDNRIEIATSSTGGTVSLLDEQGQPKPDTRPVSIRGRDIALDPRTLEFELTSGAMQHGMSFDDWGRKFVCGNHNPIQQVMYEERYLRRAPYVVAPPSRVEICEEGQSGPVYRTSPLEPWRVVRTRMRVTGQVKGAIEGGGTPAGYFTSATGVTIYRGTALPADMAGMAFIGEVAGNLVHRRRLDADGLQFISRRIDDKSELLTSNDIWFRPAQFAHGPDGALYVADVCRELIETPVSIPDDIRKHLDERSGIDRGRIYRIVGVDFKQPTFRKLAKASTDELVVTLAHPNAWHRQTASRLLYQRQARTAVPALVRLAEAGNPLARLHALYVLDGLESLNDSIVARALDDRHPQIRRHAVRLSERLETWPETITRRLYAMVDDDDLEVRYQLAFTLGMMPSDSERDAALVRLAERDGENSWMRFAVLVSLSSGDVEAGLANLVSDEALRSSKAGNALFAALAGVLGRQAGQIEPTLAALSESDNALSLTLARSYLDGLVRSGRPPKKVLASGDTQRLPALAKSLVNSSRQTAVDATKSPAVRARAIAMLPLANFADVRDVLSQLLLDQQQPGEVQQAVLESLERFDDPRVAPLVIEAWPALSPRMRAVASETLFGRRASIVALLDAIEAGNFAARDVEPARRQWLAHSDDQAVRDRATKLFGDMSSGRRNTVVANYRTALQLSGDVDRGRAIFQKTCVSCHRLEGKGTEVGPSLTTAKNRGAEFILLNVLDPSREVNPQYVNYVLMTDDGRSVTGLIASETATSVTLRRAEGASETVLRSQIEQLQSTGLSLMPEGLEQQFDAQGMADLIAYLLAVQ
jgi:putative membrane-bound dehydrogenase-like protein